MGKRMKEDNPDAIILKYHFIPLPLHWGNYLQELRNTKDKVIMPSTKDMYAHMYYMHPMSLKDFESISSAHHIILKLFSFNRLRKWF